MNFSNEKGKYKTTRPAKDNAQSPACLHGLGDLAGRTVRIRDRTLHRLEVRLGNTSLSR